MSDNFWKKFSYFVGFLPIGALFGLMAYVTGVEIRDLDLWLHLAMGRFIVENHFIPSYDVLSCSIQGAPWVNHEWLFQVITYSLYHSFGPDGIIKLQTALVVSTMFLLLILGYNKDKQLVITFFLCLVYLVFQQRFTNRPDLFSLLFFTIYIFVLALHVDKKWSTYVLVIVQVLWTNIHGFFFFGPLFVLIGLASEWMKRRLKLPFEWNDSGRLTDQEYQRLKWTFVFVVAACLINPGFVKGAWYPLQVFFSLSGENKIFFHHIQELQKPIQWETLFDLSGQFSYYKLIILISFVSFVFNRRKIDISALLFWLVFLIFSLQAARNVAFFAFAAYLTFITNVMNISSRDIAPLRFTEKKFQYLTSAILKIILLLWIMDYGKGISTKAYYDFDKYEMKSEFGGISLQGYPDKAVDFLVKNRVKGNFFNDFNSGAYLLGRCFPDIKVFIDGRTEVYGGEFFKRYQKIWDEGDAKTLEDAVQRYSLTGALINFSRQAVPEKLLSYFYNSKDWKLVYFDGDGIIFLKDIEPNKELIKEFQIDLNTWSSQKMDFYKLGSAGVEPVRNHNRAVVLESLGFNDKALEEIDEALKISPGHSNSYQLKGKIYAKQKDYRRAFDNFRLAALYSPYNKKLRFNLALSCYDSGEYECATKQYKAIMELWPKDPKGYFLMARTHAKNKKYEEGYAILLKALKMDPNAQFDILLIGDVYREAKQYDHAIKVYTSALVSGRGNSKVYQKLGDLYKDMGENDKAREAYQKAVSDDPNDEDAKKKLEEFLDLKT